MLARDVYKQCGRHYSESSSSPAHTLQNKLNFALHTAARQRKFRLQCKRAHLKLLAVPRAAASHWLRYLMWETQFGEGERQNRGKAHKFITSGLAVTLPGFFRGASAFLSCHTPLNLQRFTTKGYFLFKKCQFFSLNNHSAHPRWLPGTPPPPMPCWTGVPPSSTVIGHRRRLPRFYSVKPVVSPNRLVLLLPA